MKVGLCSEQADGGELLRARQVVEVGPGVLAARRARAPLRERLSARARGGRVTSRRQRFSGSGTSAVHGGRAVWASRSRASRPPRRRHARRRRHRRFRAGGAGTRRGMASSAHPTTSRIWPCPDRASRRWRPRLSPPRRPRAAPTLRAGPRPPRPARCPERAGRPTRARAANRGSGRASDGCARPRGRVVPTGVKRCALVEGEHHVRAERGLNRRSPPPRHEVCSPPIAAICWAPGWMNR